MAYQVKHVPTDHKDLIHDVAYDFHGRRMATCSSDQNVKVWDLSEGGEWVCTASWKAHNGSVWRVTWAHPEFGQVLATCSFDRYAAVWEELVGEWSSTNQSQWVRRAGLADSRTSVADVKFAPKCKQLGLQLATCSADGIIRIYEAPDVMNLSQWSLQHDINCKMTGCSSLSWCVPWNQPPLIAVGCNDPNNPGSAKVQIYEYNENQRKWVKAVTIMTVTDPVHDLSFAPNFGRSFHMLAVSSKDMHIVGLKPLGDPSGQGQGSTTKFELLQIAQSDQHATQTWRLSWNVTGTVLATCSDDGFVRLWKANYMGHWKCVKVLKGEGGRAVEERLQVTQSISTTSIPRTKHTPTTPVSHPSHVFWH